MTLKDSSVYQSTSLPVYQSTNPPIYQFAHNR